MSARVRDQGRAATLRLVVGAAVGAWVCWLLLATGISAQQGTCQAGVSGYPTCQTQTAQASQSGQQVPTPTFTPVPTNAPPGAAATAAPPNSAVILGGR